MLVGDLIMQGLSTITEKGWNDQIRHECDGSVCAIGALEVPLGILYNIEFHPLGMKAVHALADAIPEDWLRDYFNSPDRLNEDRIALNAVARYNNSHDRTTVEQWFEKVAADVGFTP